MGWRDFQSLIPYAKDDEDDEVATNKLTSSSMASSSYDAHSAVSPPSIRDQAILTVKSVFAGTRVLSGEETQIINDKGYFDPTELTQDQLSKEGSE